MANTLTISTRALGQRRPLLDDWQIDWPPPPTDDRGDSDPLTLRQLITRIVRAEVAAFAARQRAERFVRVLTARSIADGAARGKISAGGRDETPAAAAPVDPEAAVETALVAFTDGLYLVLLDGVEQRDLDARVYVSASTKLTFLRLTLIAGA
jgi:hypothetical protein